MSVFSVCKKVSFSCAHRLMHDNGKCANIHGHNYEAIVKVVFECKDIKEIPSGMLMDFSLLEKYIKELTNKWDHNALLNREDFYNNYNGAVIKKSHCIYANFDLDPTAEVMAFKLKEFVEKKLRDESYILKNVEVTLYETPNSFVEVK